MIAPNTPVRIGKKTSKNRIVSYQGRGRGKYASKGIEATILDVKSAFGGEVKLYGISLDVTDGSISENEGFIVEMASENPEMQKLLDSIHKTWHFLNLTIPSLRYILSCE